MGARFAADRVAGVGPICPTEDGPATSTGAVQSAGRPIREARAADAIGTSQP